MIYRLTYCNKEGVEARVDIQKGLATPVIEIEGTGRPFILSYNNDKGDKSGMFLSSSADIEIYETSEFNIDNLKTSNETELSVTHYIDNVVSWQGFIIPDFFSIEVRNNPVITMTASDRLGTLKNVTLSDLPSMISLRELAILCLNKTGLSIPLRTMADFNNGTGTNDFFNSKILTQRLSDTKGRSISCYDILSSILTASNSFLVQRSGGWHIINKIQHEAGSGKLYTGERTFVNWSDVIFNFSDISTGARRTIIPVAGSTGVYHEYGGGKLHPDNYDFSQGLTGWTPVGGFVAGIGNQSVNGYKMQSGVYVPDYGEVGLSHLKNANPYQRNVNPIYLESAPIAVPYSGSGAVNIEFDINGVGPMLTTQAVMRIAIVAQKGGELLTLHHGGAFAPMPSDNPPVFEKRFKMGFTSTDFTAGADTQNMRVSGTLESSELEGWELRVRIYGGGSYSTILINAASIHMKSSQETPKGAIYKRDQGADFTKAHDIETAIFGDYLTGGLNGYFYNYPIDDTSSLYNSSNELTSKWTAYNDTEQLPLLQHITRQKSRLFSVAHDLLSAEIEVSNFDPLAIFVACEKRYTVVSAQFDFFKSNLSVELEEVAFQNANVRDYIYSYFGDGESGIKSIGGISGGGGGGGTGGGLTPEQLEILSWWKKDPDNPNTIFTEMNAYSKLELSAYGVGDGGAGGGGGIIESVYGYSNLGQTFNNANLTDTFNAYTINQINTRLVSVESGSATTVNTTGTGDLLASVSKVGNNINFIKGNQSWNNLSGKPSVFAPSAHSHPISDITNLQTTLNSKLETSIFNTHNNDNVRHITGAERIKWDGVVTDFGNLEIGGRNLLLNSNFKTDSYNGWRGVHGTQQITQDGYIKTYTSVSTAARIEKSFTLSEIGTFTFSVKVKTNVAISWDNWDDLSIQDIKVKLIEDDFEIYSITFTNTDAGRKIIRGYQPDAPIGTTTLIEWEKLEKGTISTDWTPAPEDQVSDWNTTDVNSFSFIKNKPTKLSDFTDNIGIGAHIANNVIHITASERSNWNDANTKKHTHDNKAIIDQLTQDNINVLKEMSMDGLNIKVNTNLYSTGEVSAYGIGSGSGGGGGSLVSWGTEANSFIPLTVEGISKTVALLGHTHTYASLLNKPTTLLASGITDAYTKLETNTLLDGKASISALNSKLETSIFNTHNNDNIRHITGAERVKWDKAYSDIEGLEIGGRNYFRDISRKSYNGNSIIPVDGFYIASTGSYGGIIFDKAYIEEGVEYILSFEYKTTDNAGQYTIADPGTATGNILPGTNVSLKLITDGVLRKKEIRFTAPTTREISICLLRSGTSGTVYYKENSIKLEKGNKATGWTPAPEDQVSDWNTTNVNSFSFIKNKPTLLSQFTDNIGVATHIANTSNPHSVTKAQVGLGSVDNTSDLNKPISTAMQNALNLKANLASPTFTGVVTAPTFTGALSGNATSATDLSRSIIAGDGLTGGGVLNADRTMTLGTPSTLTASTTNEATATSHTHAITTTSVGLANTIVQTDASGGVRGEVIRIGANWTLELVGTELQVKYNGALKQRFLSDGSFVATGEVTAFA